MSHTFTHKGSYSRQDSRRTNQAPGSLSAPRGSTHQSQLQDNTSRGAQSSGMATGSTQRQFERREAYSVLKADENKRRKIQAGAQKEAHMYQEHCQRNRVSYVSCGGTTGGQLGEGSARQRSQHELSTSQLTRQQKSEKYRIETKEREERQYESHKQQQRHKAEENVKREEARDMAARHRHDEGRMKWVDELSKQGKHS